VTRATLGTPGLADFIRKRGAVLTVTVADYVKG
jgi:hypothetical protein